MEIITNLICKNCGYNNLYDELLCTQLDDFDCRKCFYSNFEIVYGDVDTISDKEIQKMSSKWIDMSYPLDTNNDLNELRKIARETKAEEDITKVMELFMDLSRIRREAYYSFYSGCGYIMNILKNK